MIVRGAVDVVVAKDAITSSFKRMAGNYCICKRADGESHPASCPGFHWEAAARGAGIILEDLEREFR